MITVPSQLTALGSSPATADAIAIRSPRGDLSFGRLLDRARRRARDLELAGVRPGSVIGIVAFNEPIVYELLLAAGYLDAALMPMSPALQAEELAALAQRADAAIVLISPATAEREREPVQAGAIPVHVLEPDPAGEPLATAYPAPSSTCWISPTGGSTGTPRLFAVSHERLLTSFALNALEWGISADQTHITVSPIAHGIGFSHSVGHLCRGGSLRLVERYDPVAAAEAAAEEESSWTAIVPTMLYDIASMREHTLDRWGLIVCAGAPLAIALREQVIGRGVRLLEYYGSTELGWVTWLEHRPGEQRSSVVGRPVLGASIRIVDDLGNEAPRGTVGIVQKRGRPYSVALSAGLSAYSAQHGDWESSGDVGWIDEDGMLLLAGRADDMVVVGGQNVYPVEVESVLRQHPLVREAVVSAAPSERLGQQIVAHVEAVEPGAVKADELMAFCRERIAKYKQPVAITVVDRLPRNSAGKIVRSLGGRLERQ